MEEFEIKDGHRIILSDGEIEIVMKALAGTHIYTTSDFANKIERILRKTQAIKLKAVNYNPPDEERTGIVCSCPECGDIITFEYLNNPIFCANCGQLLEDWEDLEYVD